MNNSTWIFIQDSTQLDRGNIVQGLLKGKLGKRFIKHPEWPPSSPDCNPLDYPFWNKTKKEKCSKTDSSNLLEARTN